MTASDEVREVIEGDLILREALARGLLKYKAAATWIKKHHDIDETLETIGKAVSRYESEVAASEPSVPWDAIGRANIHRKNAVSVFLVRKSSAARECLYEVSEDLEIDNHECLHLLSDERYFTVIVPKDRRQDVLATFVGNEDLVIDPVRDFCALQITSTEGEGRGGTLLSVFISSLTARGITVPYALSGARHQTILLAEDDFDEAFNLLHEIIAENQPSD